MKTLETLTVLYVENDELILQTYQSFLESYCKKLYIASDGEEGYSLYQKYHPDIVIMDLYVAKYYDVLLAHEIRKWDNETVLVALTDPADRELLLEVVELYFSSYIVKPSSCTELLNTLLQVSEKVVCGDILPLPYEYSWNVQNKILFCQEKVVDLTRREQKLFDLLINKDGAPCGEDEIFYHVWEENFNKTITNDSIRTLIKNLRKKLPDGLIENQYGVGYKINI